MRKLERNSRYPTHMSIFFSNLDLISAFQNRRGIHVIADVILAKKT